MKKKQTAVLAPEQRPAPPADLPSAAADQWNEICAALPPDYFTQGDLPLLHALVVATHQKAQADALVEEEGLVKNGKAHPAARLSVQLAASVAALSSKLRLCQSSRTRPDAAGLKRALSGMRPWESSPDVEEFFQ